jgi:NifU-like protein involved in Fe-S cluster formation
MRPAGSIVALPTVSYILMKVIIERRYVTAVIWKSMNAASSEAAQPGQRMVNLNDLYNDRILELAANMPATKRLERPDATAHAHSKLCGSKVAVDLTMDGDVVTAYGQDVKACLLGQTSAAVMGHNIVGSHADELRGVAGQMRRMLKQGGEPPSGKWADLAMLEPVRDYKARHASTLLVFDAVLDAIGQIERARAAGEAAGAPAGE